MSIIADLFVASPDDAPAYEERFDADPPDPRFDVRRFKGFTQLELEVLWSMLAGEEWSPERHTLESVGEPAESRWLVRFPDRFVELLAALGPAELPQLASKWGAIEELSASGDEMKPVLDGLTALARSAKKSDKALFLWGSL